VLPDTSEDPDVDPPAECVTWKVTTSGSPARVHYRRSVAQSCGGPAVETSEVLSVLAALPGVTDTPFTYRLQCHPVDCNAAATPPAGRPCSTWPDTNVTGKSRGWIIGVRMDVQAGSVEARSASTNNGFVDATIRSRTTTDYASALGC
jgi:hypothetical protein